jgi:hypothetical protein
MAEDVLDTTGLAIAVHEAIEGLMEVGLVVRVGDLLQPTPAALRSGELELGL